MYAAITAVRAVLADDASGERPHAVDDVVRETSRRHGPDGLTELVFQLAHLAAEPFRHADDPLGELEAYERDVMRLEVEAGRAIEEGDTGG